MAISEIVKKAIAKKIADGIEAGIEAGMKEQMDLLFTDTENIPVVGETKTPEVPKVLTVEEELLSHINTIDFTKGGK